MFDFKLFDGFGFGGNVFVDSDEEILIREVENKLKIFIKKNWLLDKVDYGMVVFDNRLIKSIDFLDEIL